jgi:hypothetical protein
VGRSGEACGGLRASGSDRGAKASRGKALGTLGKAIEGPARALEAAEWFRRGLQ